MAGDARRGVAVLTAMTPVVTAAVGVAINLATDGRHSWWAWVLVGVVTLVSVVVAVMLARRQGPSEGAPEDSARSVTGWNAGAITMEYMVPAGKPSLSTD